MALHFILGDGETLDNIGATDISIRNMIDVLNSFYADSDFNINFYPGCIDIINDNDLVEIDTHSEAFWMHNANGNGGLFIDVYIVGDLFGASGRHYGLSKFIVTERHIYANRNGTTTLAHEIGHYFDLEHTHRKYDKGDCKREAVSRTRRIPWYCLRAGVTCEKNGDYICDTPADPRLSNKVDSGCNYTDMETDPWGDTYVPDTRNMMSYARRSCRQRFSEGQFKVMERTMIEGGTANEMYRYHLDGYSNPATTAKPDMYEPDDSPTPGIPRPIFVGETQCRSFHTIGGECNDPVDWLELFVDAEYNDNVGTTEKYLVKVEQTIPEITFPVADVKFYLKDPITEIISDEIIATLRGQSDNEIEYELPCDIENIYIEVIKKEENNVGDYLISVKASDEGEVNIVSDPDLICEGTDLYIESDLIPYDLTGEFVTWESSNTVQLSTSQGSGTEIVSLVPYVSEYWVKAIINIGGCTKEVRRFLYPPLPEDTRITIVEDVAPCLRNGRIDPGQYHIEPELDVTWEISDGRVQPNNLPSSQVFVYPPRTTGGYLLKATYEGDACTPQELNDTYFVFVEECNPKLIELNPNPAYDVLNLEILESFNLPSGNQFDITIYNRYSNMMYHGNTIERTVQINVSQYPGDIYNIIVNSGEAIESATFIVSNEAGE